MTVQKTGQRNFWLIFVINLLISMSYQIMNPTLPKYVVSQGLEIADAGIVTTAFVITSLMIRPFSGRWSSRGSLRRLMNTGICFIFLAILTYSVSRSMAALIAGRLLNGLGWGLATTPAAAIAANSLPEKKIGSGIGIFGLTSCISNAVAPNLGLALTAGGSFQPLFITGMMMPAAAFGLSFLLKMEKTVTASEEAKHGLRWDDFFSVRCLLPMGMILLLSVSVSSVSSFLALYAESIRVAGIGMFFTIYAVSLFAVKPLSGKAVDRFGIGRVILVCSGLMAGAFALISAGGSLAVFLCAAVLYGAGYGGLQPALQAWSFQRETPERRGVASSTFFIGLDAGTGIGAAIAGFMAQYLGYRELYAAMIVPIALGAGIYMLFARKREGAES